MIEALIVDNTLIMWKRICTKLISNVLSGDSGFLTKTREQLKNSKNMTILDDLMYEIHLAESALRGGNLSFTKNNHFKEVLDRGGRKGVVELTSGNQRILVLDAPITNSNGSYILDAVPDRVRSKLCLRSKGFTSLEWSFCNAGVPRTVTSKFSTFVIGKLCFSDGDSVLLEEDT